MVGSTHAIAIKMQSVKRVMFFFPLTALSSSTILFQFVQMTGVVPEYKNL